MRPHVIYVSYDGAAEPLGVSQILPYLESLARQFEITLVSFEKPGTDPTYAAGRLAAAGVTWRPLNYHSSPKVLSTARDIAAGSREIDRVASEAGGDIIHVRSYVPALMALRSHQIQRAKLLFDIRGFWADERVEGGIWRRGALFKVAKRYERRFFARADAVVTLTEASVPWIRKQIGERPTPVEVIPTCVDLERFRLPPASSAEPVALWNGSIGTWYRFDLAYEVAAALGLKLKVITRDVTAAREALGDRAAEIVSARPDEMPDHLAVPHVGLSLVQPSFSKLASAPTRVAEHLAMGAPVLVTDGVGDLRRIVETDHVGTAFVPGDGDSLACAAVTLGDFLGSPETLRERCRGAAEARFSASQGAQRYASLYERLTG